jgi:hypothetical protein
MSALQSQGYASFVPDDSDGHTRSAPQDAVVPHITQ